METERCPSCAASVPPGAGWCGQCYAVLRPAQALAPAPVERSFQPLSPPLTQPLTQSTTPPITAPAGDTLLAPPAAPAEQAAGGGDPARPGWPCIRCHAVNDVSADSCRQCGAGFLAGVESHDLALPGIGSTRRLDKSHKAALIVGGTFACMLFLVGLSIIFGALL